MPLVGVDWSHLGVAHLFSAIKVCFEISRFCSFITAHVKTLMGLALDHLIGRSRPQPTNFIWNLLISLLILSYGV